MTPGHLDTKKVLLLPDQLYMKESTDLTLYTISHWSLEQRNTSSPGEGVRMGIVLKRRIMNELMTTYLPSVLLIMITFATTSFKPIYFEAALSVNLTIMLVLTTIFKGVMEELPTTAYIKMIDVWLVFCQLIPFTEVILLTLIENRRMEEENVVQMDSFEKDNISTIQNQDAEISEMKPKPVLEGWQVRDGGLKWLKIAGKKSRLINRGFLFLKSLESSAPLRGASF